MKPAPSPADKPVLYKAVKRLIEPLISVNSLLQLVVTKISLAEDANNLATHLTETSF
jgi:hypothetical protein